MKQNCVDYTSRAHSPRLSVGDSYFHVGLVAHTLSFLLTPVFAQVTDLRPQALRTNYTDVSTVEKYTLPTSTYESLPDSVLAWKKSNQLGRFDPNAPAALAQKIAAHNEKAAALDIASGRRCRVGGEDAKRGVVMYVGDVPEIPGEHAKGTWVGVMLDEPTGKNDGSVDGKRYWTQEGRGEGKFGLFVRPERVEVGEWPALDDLDDNSELEEI